MAQSDDSIQFDSIQHRPAASIDHTGSLNQKNNTIRDSSKWGAYFTMSSTSQSSEVDDAIPPNPPPSIDASPSPISPSSSTAVPLAHCWCFYFDDGNFHSRASSSSSSSSTSADFLRHLVCLGSFKSIQKFWSYFNSVDQNIHRICRHGRFNLRLFKEGVEPMWDAPSQQRGGRWVLKYTPSSDLTKTREIWFELLMAVVGEQLPMAHTVSGCVLACKPHRNEVQLWVSDPPYDSPSSSTVNGRDAEASAQQLALIQQQAHDNRLKAIAHTIRTLLRLDDHVRMSYIPHSYEIEKARSLAMDSSRDSSVDHRQRERDREREREERRRVRDVKYKSYKSQTWPIRPPEEFMNPTGSSTPTKKIEREENSVPLSIDSTPFATAPVDGAIGGEVDADLLASMSFQPNLSHDQSTNQTAQPNENTTQPSTETEIQRFIISKDPTDDQAIPSSILSTLSPSTSSVHDGPLANLLGLTPSSASGEFSSPSSISTIHGDSFLSPISSSSSPPPAIANDALYFQTNPAQLQLQLQQLFRTDNNLDHTDQTPTNITEPNHASLLPTPVNHIPGVHYLQPSNLSPSASASGSTSSSSLIPSHLPLSYADSKAARQWLERVHTKQEQAKSWPRALLPTPPTGAQNHEMKLRPSTRSTTSHQANLNPNPNPSTPSPGSSASSSRVSPLPPRHSPSSTTSAMTGSTSDSNLVRQPSPSQHASTATTTAVATTSMAILAAASCSNGLVDPSLSTAAPAMTTVVPTSASTSSPPPFPPPSLSFGLPVLELSERQPAPSVPSHSPSRRARSRSLFWPNGSNHSSPAMVAAQSTNSLTPTLVSPLLAALQDANAHVNDGSKRAPTSQPSVNGVDNKSHDAPSLDPSPTLKPFSLLVNRSKEQQPSVLTQPQPTPSAASIKIRQSSGASNGNDFSLHDSSSVLSPSPSPSASSTVPDTPMASPPHGEDSDYPISPASSVTSSTALLSPVDPNEWEKKTRIEYGLPPMAPNGTTAAFKPMTRAERKQALAMLSKVSSKRKQAQSWPRSMLFTAPNQGASLSPNQTPGGTNFSPSLLSPVSMTPTGSETPIQRESPIPMSSATLSRPPSTARLTVDVRSVLTHPHPAIPNSSPAHPICSPPTGMYRTTSYGDNLLTPIPTTPIGGGTGGGTTTPSGGHTPGGRPVTLGVGLRSRNKSSNNSGIISALSLPPMTPPPTRHILHTRDPNSAGPVTSPPPITNTIADRMSSSLKKVDPSSVTPRLDNDVDPSDPSSHPILPPLSISSYSISPPTVTRTVARLTTPNGNSNLLHQSQSPSPLQPARSLYRYESIPTSMSSSSHRPLYIIIGLLTLLLIVMTLLLLKTREESQLTSQLQELLRQSQSAHPNNPHQHPPNLLNHDNQWKFHQH